MDLPGGIKYFEMGLSGHVLYRAARFYSVREVVKMMKSVGLSIRSIVATIDWGPDQIGRIMPPIKAGTWVTDMYGFACIIGEKA